MTRSAATGASSVLAQELDAYQVTGSSPGCEPQPLRPKRASEVPRPPLASAATVPLNSPFCLALGGSLTDASVPYEIAGPPGAPVIVVLGGISANCHVASNSVDPTAGWWESLVGQGAGIDTDRFRVLGMTYLGHPGTLGNAIGGDAWPTLSPKDQAEALRQVLRHAGLSRVAAVVGSSLGGTVALSFAICFPDLLERLVILGAGHQPHPMATALRSAQRRIVRFAKEVGRPTEGLRIARALALTTYRSSAEFAERFDPLPQVGCLPLAFESERYLIHNGDRWAEQFDPDCFLLLSECMDAAREQPEQLSVPTTAVSFENDSVAPNWLVEKLVDLAPSSVRHVYVPTRYGHDAFLKEVDTLSGLLRGALDQGVAS